MNLSWGKGPFQFQTNVRATAKAAEEEVQEIVDDTGRFLKFLAEKYSPADTGRLEKSWEIKTENRGKRRTVTVSNTATTPKGVYYGQFVEHGYHHWRSGKYIKGQRFLARAVKAAEVRQKGWIRELNKKLKKRFENG